MLRIVIFAVAVVAGVLAIVDWAVRTRRLNPFGVVARFMRRTVDPLLLPVERRVVRAGGRPSTAAFWSVAVIVIAGLLTIMALEFLTQQVALAASAVSFGAASVVHLVIHWVFALLQFAVLFRVISSWIRVSPFSRWVRWSYVLTEWFLQPLRRLMPTVGMLDITPIVAYFGLMLLERVVLSVV